MARKKEQGTAEHPAWRPPQGAVPEWLQPKLNDLVDQARTGRLPHALLLAGPAGTGKSLLAGHLVQALMCGAPGTNGTPCGHCEPCRALGQGLHPDFTHLAPEDQRTVITVDAVRGISQALNLSSRFGSWRIALIDPADAMNVSAANSLLKTLEEPPEGALLLLVSSRPARLSATIRSRCRRLEVPIPPADVARSWFEGQGERISPKALALTGGAPFRALAWDRAGLVGRLEALAEDLAALRAARKDPVGVAKDWVDAGVPVFLDLLATLLSELARLQAAGPRATRAEVAQTIGPLASGWSRTGVLTYLDEVQVAQGRQEHPLNPQMVIEALLIRCVESQ